MLGASSGSGIASDRCLRMQKPRTELRSITTRSWSPAASPHRSVTPCTGHRARPGESGWESSSSPASTASRPPQAPAARRKPGRLEATGVSYQERRRAFVAHPPALRLPPFMGRTSCPSSRGIGVGQAARLGGRTGPGGRLAGRRTRPGGRLAGGGGALDGGSLVGGLDEVCGSVVDRELVRGEFVDGAGDDVVVAVAPSQWHGVSRFSPAVCSAGTAAVGSRAAPAPGTCGSPWAAAPVTPLSGTRCSSVPYVRRPRPVPRRPRPRPEGAAELTRHSSPAGPSDGQCAPDRVNYVRGTLLGQVRATKYRHRDVTLSRADSSACTGRDRSRFRSGIERVPVRRR